MTRIPKVKKSAKSELTRAVDLYVELVKASMKVGLIGYGAMGRLVGQLAVEKGDEIALTIDLDGAGRSVDELGDALRICDVAIDFSIADAVPKNAEAAARAGVPLVVGTDWLAISSRSRSQFG